MAACFDQLLKNKVLPLHKVYVDTLIQETCKAAGHSPGVISGQSPHPLLRHHPNNGFRFHPAAACLRNGNNNFYLPSFRENLSFQVLALWDNPPRNRSLLRGLPPGLGSDLQPDHFVYSSRHNNPHPLIQKTGWTRGCAANAAWCGDH